MTYQQSAIFCYSSKYLRWVYTVSQKSSYFVFRKFFWDTVYSQQLTITILTQCLRCFYGTVIRPVLEYACPVWHTSLTAAQMKALESLQRRALCIIYEDSDYMLLLIRAGFDTLEARREQLTERFFRRSVLRETSCLHYLLPSKRDVSVTSRLRHARTLELLKCRTVKFRHSLIPYCLDHYV